MCVMSDRQRESPFKGWKLECLQGNVNTLIIQGQVDVECELSQLNTTLLSI